jgi:hypothetical protein
VRALYVVHPVPEQREFARSVIDHWHVGYGRSHDSRRVEALNLLEIVDDLDTAVAAAERTAGRRPEIVHTSAREEQGLSFAALRERMAQADAPPVLILLGTGFGLAPAARARADLALQSSFGARGRQHHSRSPARPLGGLAPETRASGAPAFGKHGSTSRE